MDPRQSRPPYSRPPERPLIHNPNHAGPPSSQPPAQPSYSSYPPSSSQPQPPVHIPFSSDPYPSTRRDPFLPSASQGHARSGSYGLHRPEPPPPAQGERPGGWGNTGTIYSCGSFSYSPVLFCGATRKPSWSRILLHVSDGCSTDSRGLEAGTWARAGDCSLGTGYREAVL